MSTYSARIIIEGGIDAVHELTEEEYDHLLAFLVQVEQRESEDRAEAHRRASEETIRSATEAFERLQESFRAFDQSRNVWQRWTNNVASARRAARPRTPYTESEALAVLTHYVGPFGEGPPASLRSAIRRAKRVTHPDTGGTSPDFQLVTAAEAILRRARHI